MSLIFQGLGVIEKEPHPKVLSYNRSYKNELGLSDDKKYVLFLGNTENTRKNSQLAQKAINLFNTDNIDFIAPFPISQDLVIKYLLSVDVLVVPSLMEGSSNVIKEAMACDCPVVATDVGDAAWLFGNEPGHFLTTFAPRDVADKIRAALDFSERHGRTNSRVRIIELGLDAEIVARRIVRVYEEVLEGKVRRQRLERTEGPKRLRGKRRLER
jgi:glycosyltransferase involved in cell wall biosynthesis